MTKIINSRKGFCEATYKLSESTLLLRQRTNAGEKLPIMQKKKVPISLLYSNRALSTMKVRIQRENDPQSLLLSQVLDRKRQLARSQGKIEIAATPYTSHVQRRESFNTTGKKKLSTILDKHKRANTTESKRLKRNNDRVLAYTDFTYDSSKRCSRLSQEYNTEQALTRTQRFLSDASDVMNRRICE